MTQPPLTIRDREGPMGFHRGSFMELQVVQQLEQWNWIVGIFATMAFAITGVLAITEDNDSDLLGTMVFGIIAGSISSSNGRHHGLMISLSSRWLRINPIPYRLTNPANLFVFSLS